MGEVISLDQRRRARGGPAATRATRGAERPPVTFWFDLSSPSTYFGAERADRMFPGLRWRPVLPAARDPWHDDGDRSGALHAAADRAAELRMPLVWPEGGPGGGRAAMRVADFAAGRGQASAFVLAASRLAFCGGFDLDDPEIFAEAAAAAALPFDDCLRAAGDRSRDAAMEAAAADLAARGALELPVVSVGHRLFCGEERLGEAAAALRDPSVWRRPARRDEFAG